LLQITRQRVRPVMDLRVIPDQSLGFLEYKFYDSDKEELDWDPDKNG